MKAPNIIYESDKGNRSIISKRHLDYEPYWGVVFDRQKLGGQGPEDQEASGKEPYQYGSCFFGSDRVGPEIVYELFPV